MNKKIIVHAFIFVCLLLGGCTNLNKNNLQENNEKIKKQLCATKNSKNETYRVRGKKYKIMKSSDNYEEVGVASWYGKRFNKRRTSSGERYNMFKMTAAHKTLPLSTNLLVTNLVNGKQVIVKINDRGPFVGDRLIDLSYGAAKKLGMIGLGTTQVSIKAIEDMDINKA